MTIAGKVLLVVIGSAEKLRSSAITTLTSQLTQCIYVEPVRIVASDRVTRSVDEQQSELLYGRRLSDSELGCAIAHRNAVTQAYLALQGDHTLKWALIVEDDADLDITTFQQIENELVNATLLPPSFVSFYSVKAPASGGIESSRKTTKVFKARRQLAAGAVCYAVNRRGLADFYNFSNRPTSCIADWPLHYSRLKFFTSVHTRVREVEGGSTIGYRPRLRVGERLLLHIRQLRHIRKIGSDHGVSVVNAVYQLIVFPAWRDAKARLELIARHFCLSAMRSSRKM